MAGKRSDTAPKGGNKGSKNPSTPKKARKKQPAEDKRDAFIRHYLITRNQSKAYILAGYKADGTGTRQNAHRLMTSDYVRDKLADAREEQLARLDVDVNAVFDKFKAVAFGDAAAITEYIVGACRYCHGTGHKYQYRHHDEYREATEAAIRESDRSGKPVQYPHNDDGGYGYSANLPPHPNCPNCDGDGIARTRFKDTRLMTADERHLFAGVKQTQHGIEYKFNDQIAALKELAERIEFYEARDTNRVNAIAELIADLQSRGQMGRMPIRKGTPKGEEP